MSYERVSRYPIALVRLEPGEWGAVNPGPKTLAPLRFFFRGGSSSTLLTRADIVLGNGVSSLYLPEFPLPRRVEELDWFPPPLRAWPPQGSLLLQFKGDDAEAVLVYAKEFGAR